MTERKMEKNIFTSLPNTPCPPSLPLSAKLLILVSTNYMGLMKNGTSRWHLLLKYKFIIF